MEVNLAGSFVTKPDNTIVQDFRNVYFERATNVFSGNQNVWCVARRGFSKFNTYDIINSKNANGIYYWKITGRLYWVVNGNLYKSFGVSISLTSFTNLGALTGITATSGCWFDEFYDGTNYLLLIKCDDGNLYTVTSADVITRVTNANYTGLSAVGRIAVMDGYVFAVKADGTIAHSDLNAPTTWTAINTINAQESPDKAKTLIRVGNYICCLGEKTIEFFRNTGNAAGSVLTRVQQLMTRIGCFTNDSVQRYQDNVFFVGQSEEQGGGVYSISPDGSVSAIDNSNIKRYIENGIAGSTSTFRSGIWSSQGHKWYVVSSVSNNLLANNRARYSIAFDLVEKTWGTTLSFYGDLVGAGSNDHLAWFATYPLCNGNQIAGVATEGTWTGDVCYMQVVSNSSSTPFGITNGYSSVLYSVDAVYADGGENCEYLIQTDQLDFGSQKAKSMMSMAINMRQESSGTLYLSWSDDGGTTWTTERTVSAADDLQRIFRLGRFRRRMFRFRWSGSFMAIKGFEPEMQTATT